MQCSQVLELSVWQKQTVEDEEEDRRKKTHAKSYEKSSFLCIDNLRAFFFICHNILSLHYFFYTSFKWVELYIETYKRSTKNEEDEVKECVKERKMLL